ncbi:uncharacterized protein BJX67DRAFT_348903 [Aspergillus lucknowensis]|uniref:Uncharacterized protein n=1 Tax=Aspergillus lucknowensis TaxID=176173 RepID=A0ABR4LX88_9EURO
MHTNPDNLKGPIFLPFFKTTPFKNKCRQQTADRSPKLPRDPLPASCDALRSQHPCRGAQQIPLRRPWEAPDQGLGDCDDATLQGWWFLLGCRPRRTPTSLTGHGIGEIVKCQPDGRSHWTSQPSGNWPGIECRSLVALCPDPWTSSVSSLSGLVTVMVGVDWSTSTRRT